MLKPENKGKLADILKYHVVAGRVYSEQVLASKSVTTLQGSNAIVTMQNGAPTIQGAKIVATDVDASNVSFTSSIASSCRLPRAHRSSASWQMPLPKVLRCTMLATTRHAPPSYSNTMHELMSTSLPAGMKSHMSSVIQQQTKRTARPNAPGFCVGVLIKCLLTRNSPVFFERSGKSCFRRLVSQSAGTEFLCILRSCRFYGRFSYWFNIQSSHSGSFRRAATAPADSGWRCVCCG